MSDSFSGWLKGFREALSKKPRSDPLIPQEMLDEMPPEIRLEAENLARLPLMDLADRKENIHFYINTLRQHYESFSGEIRMSTGFVLNRAGTDLYGMEAVMAMPGAPPEVVLMTLELMYKQHPEACGVVFAFDHWGLKPEKAREIDARLREIAECTDPDLQAEMMISVPKPTDLPREERTEVSTYWALIDDGTFIAGEQFRGLENELHFFDELNPNKDYEFQLGTSNNPLADTLRRIVGIK